MKVLLTGSEGFIGRYVRAKLEARGHDVVGVDCLVPVVHGDNPEVAADTIARRVSDLRGAHFDCDVLIHMAALVSVADSMVNPWMYYHYNVTDTLSMLGRLEDSGFRPKLVVASSSSVYGNVKLPFREDGPTDPTNIYGLTKLDQEKMIRLFGTAWNVDTVALRFFNVYGPGQAMRNKFTGVMANFARELLAGRRPQITQDGWQIRDFIYVEDVAEAVVLAATTPTVSGIFNVCTGLGTSMSTATTLLAQALNVPLEPEITGAYRIGDQDNVLGDNTNFLLQFPEWRPRAYEEGVRAYAECIK